MKITLVNLGMTTFEDGSVSPPIGIMSIAGYIREKLKVSVNIINQREDNCSADILIDKIKKLNPEILGISCMTNSAKSLKYIVLKIREYLPATLIVIGGPHISAIGAFEALKDIPAHIAVEGEGEKAVELIIEARNNGGNYETVPGLTWRDLDNNIITNEGSIPIILSLDSLPFLPYDLIDIHKYWRLKSIGSFRYIRYADLSTSRGCPYKCIYCHKIHGKKYRAQSPERIIMEIEYLVNKYNIKQIEIIDDTFNLKVDRVLSFCNLLTERKLGVKFSFPVGLRSDLLTEEVIDALVNAGMNFCLFALETGSERMQKVCRKNLNIEKFLKAIEWTAKRHVFTCGTNMFGLPTEQGSEIEETIRIACKSRLHTALFFIATPFPGTELYNLAQANMPEKLNSIEFESTNLHTINVNLSNVTDNDLKKYVKKAYRRFYFSPTRIYRIIRDTPYFTHLIMGSFHVLLRLSKYLFPRGK